MDWPGSGIVSVIVEAESAIILSYLCLVITDKKRVQDKILTAAAIPVRSGVGSRSGIESACTRGGETIKGDNNVVRSKGEVVIIIPRSRGRGVASRNL